MGSIATIKEEEPTDAEDDGKNNAAQINNEMIEDIGYGTNLGSNQMYEDMAALEI